MEITIRRADERDIPELDRLLYQVHKVHSDIRPDLFVPGHKKYNDAELSELLKNDSTPVFAAMCGDTMAGYAFCVLQGHSGSESLTDIKTLYIDDLCVDEAARGKHVGTALYEYVIGYARSVGCYNVTLNVWAGNDPAMRFYERIGLTVQKTGMEFIL